jgi:hypothetical protein
VLGERDCRWLLAVLVDLERRGYFDAVPALGERARALVEDCRAVTGSGQSSASCSGPSDDAVMSYEEALAALLCSRSTLQRRVRSGELRAVRGVLRADVERLRSSDG